jgi:hypothetical protein
MKQTKKNGNAIVPGQSLEALAQRLANWRETRQRGQHIPDVLWTAAVGLVKEHAVEQVAHHLQLKIGRLHRRLQSGDHRVSANNPDSRFIEMRVSAITTATTFSECTVEMDNGRGAKMRVQLSGNGLVGLSTLCSSFLGAP